MKILMLGWEYPPHIAGGLGTACEGLTAALATQGVSIHFVMPRMFGDEQVAHMRFSATEPNFQTDSFEDPSISVSVEKSRIPAFLAPYWSSQQFNLARRSAQNVSVKLSVGEDAPWAKALIDGEVYGVEVESAIAPGDSKAEQNSGVKELYSGDIFEEVERFTARIVSDFADGAYDIIHAHDWMTFPAGVALSKLTDKPLIAHVHSLECDRSGIFGDLNIEAIEKQGLEAATRVVAVSHYTERSIERHYGIPLKKISVVHNGIYPRQVVNDYRQNKTWPRHVVLFLGRVTQQKGPEYFVEVASKVVPRVKDILFVLAGTGDLVPTVIAQVKDLKLDNHFLFTGFVQGEELEELFSVADLYVMPSVSEPFGLTALEAISFDTPVIVSKQSGVSEVVRSVLMADFWDTDRFADLIVDTLSNPELSMELVKRGKEEISRLHWDAAALKVIEIYNELAPSNKRA